MKVSGETQSEHGKQPGTLRWTRDWVQMFYILPALFYCFCTLRSWGRGAGFFSSQGPPQCIEQRWIIPLVVSASILMHNKIIWGSLQICWLLKPFAGKTGVSLFKNLRSLGIYVLGKDLSVYFIIFFNLILFLNFT